VLFRAARGGYALAERQSDDLRPRAVWGLYREIVDCCYGGQQPGQLRTVDVATQIVDDRRSHRPVLTVTCKPRFTNSLGMERSSSLPAGFPIGGILPTAECVNADAARSTHARFRIAPTVFGTQTFLR
jgi:hypothetical protein